jgi:hypothetical protein
MGMTIEFALSIWHDIYMNGNRVSLVTLPLYGLLWNVLPLIVFGIGKFLQKQGR